MKIIIDKIIKWLSHWDKDKVLHFTLCLLISIVSACVMKMCHGNALDILAAAFFAGFLAGVGKELYDECNHKDSDSSDWAADCVGTILGTVIALVLVL